MYSPLAIHRFDSPSHLANASTVTHDTITLGTSVLLQTGDGHVPFAI